MYRALSPSLSLSRSLVLRFLRLSLSLYVSISPSLPSLAPISFSLSFFLSRSLVLLFLRLSLFINISVSLALSVPRCLSVGLLTLSSLYLSLLSQSSLSFCYMSLPSDRPYLRPIRRFGYSVVLWSHKMGNGVRRPYDIGRRLYVSWSLVQISRTLVLSLWFCEDQQGRWSFQGTRGFRLSSLHTYLHANVKFDIWLSHKGQVIVSSVLVLHKSACIYDVIGQSVSVRIINCLCKCLCHFLFLYVCLSRSLSIHFLITLYRCR